MDYKSLIKSTNDFPIEGIIFRDLNPIYANGDAFNSLLIDIEKLCQGKTLDIIIGIEARGFIVGAALANRLGIGFACVRKKGKLPPPVISASYELEYGEDVLEISEDALKNGNRVLIVDDVVATGGTIIASVDLLNTLKADIKGIVSIIELLSLNGSNKITQKTNIPVQSLCQY